MEQDCVTGLYQSLGLSVGAEFSSEDVSRLYRKVFHVPSSTDEACMAMKKIAGGNNNWSCVGENVLDVLLEMEKERVKKEKLYWDLQLLNVGNLNSPYVMDKSVIIDPHVLNFLHQSTDASTFKKSYDSDIEPSHSDLQMWTSVGGNELHGSVRVARRLRKAARQCWIRLASEGLQGIMPSPWQGQSLKVKGQAWGCVSLSDVLLLLDVKYDVMTHLLYTEMLQEHHTQSIWESWLPWQQHKEEGGLEDLAEEALESGDMLHLAELPGAFRMYRVPLGVSFKNSPESREKSWSAASLLYELHQSRQQERDSLTVLGDRLDRESWRLLCLYIRLATLRAQREKLSYSALLAARQSWETWPHVSRLHRAEQAALWLHGEKEEEQINDLISLSPQQQALLQLLVLTQEQERKHLVKLVHGVSLEDLQRPGCMESPKEENHRQAVLRNGCIKRLKDIHTSLQIQNDSQTNICSKTAMGSQHQLEHCFLLLLTHLLELQDVQASILLSTMLDKSSQHLQVLRDEYESQLRSQSNSNLLQLLLSDALLTSGSMIILDPNLIENKSNKQKSDKSSSTGPTENQNTSDGSSEAAAVSDVNIVQAADGANRQDVCTGCGAVMEEMPYLEILCTSDATSKTQQSLSAEGRAHEEEEGSVTQSPDSYEKQGSLITLAWSKPPEDDADYDTAAADGGSEKSQDSQSGLKDKHQPGDMSSIAQYAKCEETSRETHDEDLKPTLFQSGSTGHDDAQSAEKPCSTEEQERTMVDNSKKEEAETLQAVHPDVFIYTTDIKSHTDDICSGLTSETAEFSSDGAEIEICATTTESQLWDLREPEPTYTDEQKLECVLTEREATRESTLMDRERTREPVSAMEREKTMRNLVDMQRKVEQKQQRDRERQLLRVQERLSIIQNRKAEEDLLGLKHTERLKHLIQDLPQEDKNQQKTVVKERLEQLRRERSYVMQSKRDRNTAGFKELLGPVALQSRETEDGAD